MDEVLKLLQVAELSLKWPNLKPLHDKAMAQLEKLAQASTAIQGSAKQHQAVLQDEPEPEHSEIEFDRRV